MTFLVFERVGTPGSVLIRNTGAEFKLGGRNLLYRAWEKHGRPMNQGWHVSADELIRLHSNSAQSYGTHCLIIDWYPKAPWGIGLIELLDVYAYTYAAEKAGEVSWTPFMLRGRDIYELKNVPPSEKRSILADGIVPNPAETDFVEFLYLQGDAGHWNYGRNGSTNAPFIQSAARDYFRQFFRAA